MEKRVKEAIDSFLMAKKILEKLYNKLEEEKKNENEIKDLKEICEELTLKVKNIF